MLGKVNEYSDKKKEEKKQEEAYNSEASKTERQIRTFIDNIYSAIKDKDYAYISMCLDKNYNECIFDNSIENLKEYIENNIVIDDSYIISKISQDEGLYQVLIGVQSENSYNTQTFTVNVIDENECELMLGEYSSFKKNNEIAKYSNLSYNLVYNYRTPDIVSYLIDITNFTDEEIVIEFNETSATSLPMPTACAPCPGNKNAIFFVIIFS